MFSENSAYKSGRTVIVNKLEKNTEDEKSFNRRQGEKREGFTFTKVNFLLVSTKHKH